jgi:hypothetical protein
MVNPMTNSRWILTLLVCWASVANADGDNTRAAVDKLAAAWAPFAKLTGDALTTAVCADADKLAALATAVPKVPPPDAAVDGDTWSDDQDGVDTELGVLADVCKQPGHQREMLEGVQKAGELVPGVDAAVAVLVDAAKARALPAAVAKFKKTLNATSFPSRRYCAQQKELAKQAAGLAAAPAGVDATKWGTAAKAVRDDVAALKCVKPMPADEELASGLIAVREQFVKLALLIPPS